MNIEKIQAFQIFRFGGCSPIKFDRAVFIIILGLVFRFISQWVWVSRNSHSSAMRALIRVRGRFSSFAGINWSNIFFSFSFMLIFCWGSILF